MLRDILVSISVSLNLIRWFDLVLHSATAALSDEYKHRRWPCSLCPVLMIALPVLHTSIHIHMEYCIL
jgi:hypothetical protein